MFVSSSLFADPHFLAYLVVFGGAAVACAVGAYRVQYISDADTRHGLIALLLTSGGWAAAHVGYLLVAGTIAKNVFYLLGLLVGFATVWAWLYFCSAYTGRSLHRNRSIWQFAGFTYVAVTLVKVTNPLHHLYYTLDYTTSPFPHLTVRHHLLYWVIMGLSYALAMVGYFMLVELYTQTSNDTKPLLGLTVLTALPAVFNLVGYANPGFLDITHEPLGVAVFAVGVLFVYVTEFQAVQLAGERDDPAIVLSDDRRIRDYNEEAASLFPALHGTDAVGAPLETTLPKIADAMRADPPLVEMDGSSRTRYYRITENRFGNRGAQLGRVLLLDDVTEQKEYEEQLREAKEAAEEADRLKTAMLANMSHELRTPLTAITGYADMLKETLEGQPELFAEKIQHGGNRLSNTLESVLDFSELEAGAHDLERSPVDLAAITEDVATRHRSSAEEASLSMEIERPDEPVRAYSNDAALRRIAENLIDNAIKFTPEGGRVSVRVREDDETVVLEVEDTGIGIDEDALPQVFEAFRQESEGMAREYEGTGLGLSIVHELVDALGGEIDVDTEKGEGTRFVVRLPAVQEDRLGETDAGRDAQA
jgi:signal transduction histidine kinase